MLRAVICVIGGHIESKEKVFRDRKGCLTDDKWECYEEVPVLKWNGSCSESG